MDAVNYEPPKWLQRKLEDILDLDGEHAEYATRSIIQKSIDKSKDLRRQQEIQLGLERLDEAIALQEAMKGGLRGLSSGFDSIDELTKGFVGGEVTIVSAKTSIGKTSFAIAIAANVAKQGKPVLFVTLEMTQPQLMQRYISYTGGLVDGKPNEDALDIAGLTFMQKADRVTPDSIEGIIKNAKENHAQLVVLDHIHYFSRGSQTDDVEKISMELSRSAKKYDIPIIAIAHTRKDSVVGGKPKDSVMDDIRGASFISQDADIVLMLNRSPEQPHTLRVKVWKNRNGGINYADNEILLSINGSNITEEWYDGIERNS